MSKNFHHFERPCFRSVNSVCSPCSENTPTFLELCFESFQSYLHYWLLFHYATKKWKYNKWVCWHTTTSKWYYKLNYIILIILIYIYRIKIILKFTFFKDYCLKSNKIVITHPNPSLGMSQMNESDNSSNNTPSISQRSGLGLGLPASHNNSGAKNFMNLQS